MKLTGLVKPVYAPQFLSAVGTGMMVPVVPLYLTQTGLSFTATSVVLAAVGLGGIVASLPAGALAARFGDRRLLVWSLAAMAAMSAAIGLTTVAFALVVFQLVIGAGNLGIRLANQTYVTQTVGPSQRGRAMSWIGGSLRVALLVGPLLGGWLVDAVGFRATFVVTGVVIAAGLVPLVSPGAADAARGPGSRRRADQGSVFASFRVHGRAIVRGGVGPALVMTARSGRLVVIPLIGDELGLSATAVGVLVAASTGAELVLFPFAGHVMDRHGRLRVMVPAFGMLALGLVLLSFAQSTAVAVVAGFVIGIGNGFSAGTMLTLGSDLAPADDPGPFLAALAAMQNVGTVAGPIAVGWFADVAGLGTSAFVLAMVMLAGIAWIVVVIGETGDRRSLPAR